MTSDLAQHHVYGASGFEALMGCPGKPVMELGLPDSYSPAADEGSAAHFLSATCLQNGKNPIDYRHFGIVCWQKDGERDGQCFAPFVGSSASEGAKERSLWKVTEEMADCVTEYVDFVRKLAKKGTLLIEQRVHFGSAIGLDGAFGTSDALILSEDGTELTVIDLKYGFREVSAKENPQMMLYALGAMEGIISEIEGVFEVEDLV